MIQNYNSWRILISYIRNCTWFIKLRAHWLGLVWPMLLCIWSDYHTCTTHKPFRISYFLMTNHEKKNIQFNLTWFPVSITILITKCSNILFGESWHLEVLDASLWASLIESSFLFVVLVFRLFLVIVHFTSLIAIVISIPC